MADNVAITAGSGTNVAADDIGSVFYQRVKLSLGADGTAVDAVAGAGAVGTGVQRITLASDDPAVALLGTIDADTGNAVTALQIMDDWDESDRAKVNIIVGQAGVAGGSGTNGATVQRVTIATDDQTASRINDALVGDYETVAASQTDQALGATGGSGDYLAGLLVVPATTSPGAVSIKDGAGSAITVFTGGSSSVSNLVPFFVPLGIKSSSGAWSVTTGANVSAVASGNFT